MKLNIKTDFGITRSVLLIGKWAIKIPQHRYGWQKFLHGMLANDQEAMWWSLTNDARLCPVLFSLPLGSLLVQRRVERMSNWSEEIDYKQFDGLPKDCKPDNFGYIDGRLVMVDYGS